MLEVRLLYKKLENYNKQLEKEVLERTAELRESVARYHSLTELTSDCYWEQDEIMKCTKLSGPVLEMLEIKVDSFVEEVMPADVVDNTNYNIIGGWNEEERAILQSKITKHEPFLDYVFSRKNPDGSEQKF